MGPRCSSKRCSTSSRRYCHIFTEPERAAMFSFFWKEMNWPQRKVYIASLVTIRSVAQRTTTEREDSRRLFSFSYSLKDGKSGLNRTVCKNFFLSTLGLKTDQVQDWVREEKLTSGMGSASTPKRPSVRAFRNSQFTFLLHVSKVSCFIQAFVLNIVHSVQNVYGVFSKNHFFTLNIADFDYNEHGEYW